MDKLKTGVKSEMIVRIFISVVRMNIKTVVKQMKRPYFLPNEILQFFYYTTLH